MSNRRYSTPHKALALALAMILALSGVPASALAEMAEQGDEPVAVEEGEPLGSDEVDVNPDSVEGGEVAEPVEETKEDPLKPYAAELAQRASKKVEDEDAQRAQDGQDVAASQLPEDDKEDVVATDARLVRAAYEAIVRDLCDEGGTMAEELRAELGTMEGADRALGLALDELGIEHVGVTAERAVPDAEPEQLIWSLVRLGELWYHVDVWSAVQEYRQLLQEQKEAQADSDKEPDVPARWLLVSDESIRKADEALLKADGTLRAQEDVRGEWRLADVAGDTGLPVAKDDWRFEKESRSASDEGSNEADDSEAGSVEHDAAEDERETLESTVGDPDTTSDSTPVSSDPADVVMRAQSGNIASGTWGTCDWEIDNGGVLHIHAGTGTSARKTINGRIVTYHSPWENWADQIVAVSTSGESGSVVVPSDGAAGLFFELSSVETMDLSSIDTSAVTSMYRMFDGCSSLRSLDLRCFNTSNVETFAWMFSGCESLESVDLSSFDTSKAIWLSAMFLGCSSLAVLDVSRFNTSGLSPDTNTSFGWHPGRITDGCTSLSKFVVGPNYDLTRKFAVPEATADNQKWYSQQAKAWFTSEQIANERNGIADVYTNAESLEPHGTWGTCSWQFDPLTGTLTIGSGKGAATNGRAPWSRHASKIKQVCTPGVGELKAEAPADISGLFAGLSSATTIDVSGLDVSGAQNMGNLFNGCVTVSSLDLSGFDTHQATSMAGMFEDCDSLVSIVTDSGFFSTANVTTMEGMFFGCSSLGSLNMSALLSKFDTGNVTSMANMFDGCASLTGLDLSAFDTGKVTSMMCMFNDCSKLATLSLVKSGSSASFTTAAVTDMCDMFAGCSALESIDLSSFDTSQVTDMGGMFADCTALESIDLSTFDTGRVTHSESMFEGCDSIALFTVGDLYDTSIDDTIPKSSCMVAAHKAQWWSENTGGWMTEQMIKTRNPHCKDTFSLYRPGSSIAIGKDTWGFENVGFEVPRADVVTRDTCCELYGPALGQTLYDSEYKDGVVPGLCLGMVIAAQASVLHDYPPVQAYTSPQGKQATQLHDVKNIINADPTLDEEWVIKQPGMLLDGKTALEYITLAHIVQDGPEYTERKSKQQIDSSEKFQGITDFIDAVESFENGTGEPIVITLWVYNELLGLRREAFGHALLPLSVDDYPDRTCVNVYDPTYNDQPNSQNHQIIFSKDSGDYTSWKYVGGHTYSNTGDNNEYNKGAFFWGNWTETFYEYLERGVYSNKQLVSAPFGTMVSADGKTWSMGSSASPNPVNPSYISPIGDSQDANNDVSNSMCWINSVSSFTFLGLAEDSCVAIAGAKRGVRFGATAGTSIRVAMEKDAPTMAQMDQTDNRLISIEFYGDVQHEISIEGMGTSHVEARVRQSGGITLVGMKNIRVQNGSGNIETVSLDPSVGCIVQKAGNNDSLIITYDFSSATISSIPAQTYTGSAITPKPTVKLGSVTLREGTDYALSYANNENPGTATVTVTGKGSYTGSTFTTFQINKADASAVTVSAPAGATYDGSAHTPRPTVRWGSRTLQEGADYTLSWSNNVNVGTATVTVALKGGLAGTKTANFVINKAAGSLDVATEDGEVLFRKVKKKAQCTGPLVQVGGAQGGVTIEKVGGSANLAIDGSGNVTVKKKSKKGTYRTTVRVTAAGDANHEAASREVTVTVRVVPKLTNRFTLTGKVATVKASKVKKKNQTVSIKKLVGVSKAKGKVTYKKAGGNKKISVASNGKVTVKKGLAPGTYNVKVKVTAAGNKDYKKGTKVVTCTVVVQ